MDEDDEFGDLYTDVLIPFTTSHPSTLSSSSPTNPPKPDLNSQIDQQIPPPNLDPTPQTPENQLSHATEATTTATPIDPLRVLDTNQIQLGGVQDESFTNKIDKDSVFTQDEAAISIPGISTSTNYIPGVLKEEKEVVVDDDDDDWDSDSEDDLQIVLNEKSVPVGMDNRHNNDDAMGSDDDEDGEDLVIVADQHPHPGIDDQDWENDPMQAADGERKDGAGGGGGDGLKINGGGVNSVGARMGYNSHLYPSHHSQFKYVRPGAPVVPGGAIAGPGGAPGQVRPVVNMSLAFGRGRGDWRPMGPKTAPGMQKPFHSGFGPTAWGNSSAGRGFGSGTEFTLPSHKTVFDIDIDSFEDKPWRNPGIDISDFFNFGLDEENWKDYCKQLEQLRLEATMQSRIRVYESGRSEQDYDPDLPPELAIAAGIQEASAENPNLTKPDGSLGAVSGHGRGAARPAILPTGRAIQVEGGFGERLPSIDTRPPRLRDSDAIIEIVLQDSADDDPMTTNDSSNDIHRDESRGGENEEDVGPNEYFDPLPQPYNGRKREVASKIDPPRSSGNNIHERNGLMSFPSEASDQCIPSSKGRASNYSGGTFGTPQDGRWPLGTRRDRYSRRSSERGNDVIPCESGLVSKPNDSERERSGESSNGEHNLEATSSVDAEVVRDQSIEQKADLHNDLEVDHSSIALEGQETHKGLVVSSDTVRDGSPLPSYKRQKLSSRVEQPTVQETDSVDGLRATRSSENSKARSVSSREYQKRRDDGEEVVQEGRPRRVEDVKRRRVEDDYSFQRKDDHVRDGRLEMERGRVLAKGREDSRISYPYRDWDLSRVKPGEIERSRERDTSVGARQRRDSDTHGRRLKDEDVRKKEHIDELGYRHRSKLRESEKFEKDEHLRLRKRVDNGDWRGPHDKDVGLRGREKDDSLMMRHENMDDSYSRRRKEEEHLKKEQVDKDILHGYKARDDVSRRKRVRDDVLDQRKREEQPRARERPDDNHSARHREDSWRERDKDERRLKQPQEDISSNRDREGRNSVRSGRDLEDKSWVGNTRVKGDSKGLGSDKDYPYKDRRRTSEHSKRSERLEDESFMQHKGRDNVYARESQFTNEERNPRHERSSTYNDRLMNASESQFMQKERHRDSGRSRESDREDQNTLGPSKRKLEDLNAHRSEKVSGKGTSEQESGTTGLTSSRDLDHSRLPLSLSKKSSHDNDVPQQRHSSRKHREDGLSDDEQQNLRRGRSKLERWTSNKDRDDIANSLSTSKAKEPARNNIDISSEVSEQPDDQIETVGSVEDQHHVGEEKTAHDMEIKEVGTESTPGGVLVESEKVGDDRHLDTVAKLKKRSERFKTPMPSEKDATLPKKVESEVLVPTQSEIADAEVKAERPARKRRWTGSS